MHAGVAGYAWRLPLRTATPFLNLVSHHTTLCTQALITQGLTPVPGRFSMETESSLVVFFWVRNPPTKHICVLQSKWMPKEAELAEGALLLAHGALQPGSPGPR